MHVPHFHVSRGPERETRLVVHEATKYPVESPLLHYTLNAPHHYRVLRDIIRENDIDVVVGAHVLAGTAMIHAAKKYDVPVIFDLKDWFPDSAAAYYKNPALQWALKSGVLAITRYNLDRSDLITTVSPGLVEKLRNYGYSAELITNGVNTDLFRPLDGRAMRSSLGIPDDAFVLGFAGAVERWYALDEVIRVFRRVLAGRPDAYLLIVGGSLFTNYSEELKQLASELGIGDRVIFTGAVEYRDMPRYIAPMDLCTIPLSPPQWIDIALPNKYLRVLRLRETDPLDADPRYDPDGRRPPLHLPDGGRVRRESPRDCGAACPLRFPGPANTDWRSKAAAFEEIFERITGSS